MAIRADLHARFAHRRPWLDVMSKASIVPCLGGELSPAMVGLWHEADEQEAARTAEMLRGEAGRRKLTLSNPR